MRNLFRFDPKACVLTVLIGLVLEPIGHTEVLEHWGGQGAAVQIYADHHAYFLFDCSEGETADWKSVYPSGDMPGSVRSDRFTEPYHQDTVFRAELTPAHTLKLTVTVEGQTPRVFELHRNQIGELHNCPLN